MRRHWRALVFACGAALIVLSILIPPWAETYPGTKIKTYVGHHAFWSIPKYYSWETDTRTHYTREAVEAREWRDRFDDIVGSISVKGWVHFRGGPFLVERVQDDIRHYDSILKAGTTDEAIEARKWRNYYEALIDTTDVKGQIIARESRHYDSILEAGTTEVVVPRPLRGFPVIYAEFLWIQIAIVCLITIGILVFLKKRDYKDGWPIIHDGVVFFIIH